jgi:uncharacterized protein YecT (DUF1311 family)
MIKSTLLVPLSALVLLHPSPARALDCAKASSPLDKLICATPELKKADEEMGAAYFKLLHDTSDAEFHEALIQSQRRWLKTRSFGPERFGQAENDKSDDREILLGITRDRLNFIRTAQPIRVMEQERKIMSNDGGGAFAGFETYCVLSPPPYGSWVYRCWGNVHRQHNERVCSSELEWASGHMSEYRLVSIAKDGKARLMAMCAIGDLPKDAVNCPGSDADAAVKPDPHWNTNPAPRDLLPRSHAGDLWKYDPDIDPDQIARPWMLGCLFAPIFPPVAVSRSDAASKK